MKHPPTLATPRGAGQSVGAALPDWDGRPPTLPSLAAPRGAGQSVGAALPDWRRMRHLAALLALVLVQAHAEGIGSLQPKLLPPERAFRLSARALDASTIEARFDIADGYYLYRDKMHFTTDPVAAAQAALPPGKPKHDAFFGDVETYRGAVVVRLPLTKAVAGETIMLHADSQGCADVGVCYPPNPQQLSLVVPRTGKPGAFVEAAPRGWLK